jgi:hypothetical protein
MNRVYIKPYGFCNIIAKIARCIYLVDINGWLKPIRIISKDDFDEIQCYSRSKQDIVQL